MKIHIKEKGGVNLTIPLPTGLALRFMGIAAKHCGEEEDGKELKVLINGLKQAKKVWGHLTIVEVKEKDGDEVTITL